MRRVVITGMGIVSPLGRGLKYNWENGILKSKSGIKNIPYFDTEQYSTKIAGIIPAGSGEGEFDPTSVIPAKVLKIKSATLRE